MKTLLLLLSFSPLLLSQKAISPAPGGNWRLTFADEFDETQLDLARWVPHDVPQATPPHEYSRQVRDRELQSFTPDAVSVSGGQLHLVGRRAGKDREYNSGIVTTFGTFSQTRGRFEIRCKVPTGHGLRRGFRLLPVPLGLLPEIAVFETIGTSPANVFFSNRWGTEDTERSFAGSSTVSDLSAGFHTVSLEWDADKLTWFVDGKQKFQSIDGIPYQPMYLVLDLAVGGKLAHDPDASTPFPASFDIDYIRVYSHAP